MEKSKEKNLGESEVLMKMTPPDLIHKDPAHVGFVQMGRNKKKKEKEAKSILQNSFYSQVL